MLGCRLAPPVALLLALLLALLAHAVPAAAQDFTAYGLASRSDNAELAEAHGFGASGAFPIEPWLQVRVGLDIQEGSHTRLGFSCRRINPDVNCQAGATIMSESRLAAVTASVMPTWHPVDVLRISAGAGVTVGQTRIEAADLDGRPALYFAPKTAHLGIALVSELRLRPLAALPFELVASWQGRLLWLDGCSSSEDLYTPFCDRTWFSDLRLGVGVAL